MSRWEKRQHVSRNLFRRIFREWLYIPLSSTRRYLEKTSGTLWNGAGTRFVRTYATWSVWPWHCTMGIAMYALNPKKWKATPTILPRVSGATFRNNWHAVSHQPSKKSLVSWGRLEKYCDRLSPSSGSIEELIYDRRPTWAARLVPTGH